MAAYAVLKDFSPVGGDARINFLTADGSRVAAYDTTSGRGLDNKAIKFNGLTNAMNGGGAMNLEILAGGNTTFPGRSLTGQFTIEFDCYWASATPLENIFLGSGALAVIRTSSTNLRLSTMGGTQINATIALNTLYHVAITKNAANLYTLWVNGASAGTATDATAWNTATSLLLFGSGSSGGSILTSPAYISGIRITNGVARYTAGFVAPSSAYPTTVGGDANWASVVALITGEERTTENDVPAPSSDFGEVSPVFTPFTTPVAAMDPAPNSEYWDIYDGGSYEFVVGADLTVLNTPSNTPFYGRVDLMEQRSRRVIRSTWSDPVTGAYAFRYLKFDPVANEPKYTLLGWDHTIANRRAVIADDQVPDLMTVFP